ncbi:MAG: metallophosphoesterase [Sulfuriferula sp.]|nr:metallophosphoesterase [Sulfuriferula sp.]
MVLLATSGFQRLFIGSVLGVSLLAAQSSAYAVKADPVVMSFATVGDSRAEPGDDLSGQDRIWLQNTKGLSRIIREIQEKKPQALFFNGDMIYGYNADDATLNRQYAYWRGMMANLMETGTYVVPVPGNHEVRDKITEDGKSKKAAQARKENSWRDNMGDLIMDAGRWKTITGNSISAFDVANTPAIGNADHIQTNQSQLSFSFDYGDSHFAVINTDPVGYDGHAPTNWLREDLQQAQARGMKHEFVFGHKLAFTYYFKPGMKPSGLDHDAEQQKQFWQVIENAGATYFCGHEHIFNISQPAKASGGKSWQVLVGSGGSPFAAKVGDSKNPTDRMYAWAIVQLHASGKVHLDAYGFDEHYGKTQLLKSMDF